MLTAIKLIWLCWLVVVSFADDRDVDDTKVTYNTGALQQLTEFRLRHRRTIDGRLCAAAFVEGQKTYTDCTTDKDPNGTVGREWCYVEVQLLGKGPTNKDWNYCQPVIDYGYLRKKANENIYKYASELSEISNLATSEVARVKQVIDLYDKVCGSYHDDISAKIKDIQDIQEKTEHLLDTIDGAQSRIHTLKGQQSALLAEVKTIRKSMAGRPENCGDSSSVADGLQAIYFDNAVFEQPAVGYDTVPQVDFTWAYIGPHESTGPYRYAIVLHGYLVPSKSGNYRFKVSADGGARFSLDDKPIIANRMSLDTSRPSKTIPILPNAALISNNSVMSGDIQLESDRPYKTSIEYFHSAPLKYKDREVGFLKWEWIPPGGELEVVPKSVLFSTYAPPDLSVSGLDLDTFGTSYMVSGNYAYWDRKDWFLADVPPRYHKLLFMKSVFPTEDVISMDFSFNLPAILYVSVRRDGPFPVLNCAHTEYTLRPTGSFISLYRAQSRDQVADEVVHLQVFYANIDEAWVNLSLVIRDLTEHPVIVFGSSLNESENDSQYKCASSTLVVSDPSGDIFDSCEASDNAGEGFGCRDGLNTIAADQIHHTWRSGPNGGLGSNITVYFKQLVQLESIVYRPQSARSNFASKIRLEMNVNGAPIQRVFETSRVSLMPQSFGITGKLRTKSVTILIEDMYTPTEGISANFQIYGKPCVENVEHNSLDAAQIPPTDVFCDTTYTDFITEHGSAHSLIATPESYDHNYRSLFKCPANCHNEYVRTIPPLFGDGGVYTQDSAICAMALHSGTCAKQMGCIVALEQQRDIPEMDGGTRNGIMSQAISGTTLGLRIMNVSDVIDNHSKLPILIDFIQESVLGGVYKGDTSALELHYNAEGDPLEYGWLSEGSTETHCAADMVPIDNAEEILKTSKGLVLPSTLVQHVNEDVTPEHDSTVSVWGIKGFEEGYYDVQLLITHPCSFSDGYSIKDVNQADVPVVGPVAETPINIQLNGKPIVTEDYISVGEIKLIRVRAYSDDGLYLTNFCESGSDDDNYQDNCKNFPLVVQSIRITN